MVVPESFYIPCSIHDQLLQTVLIVKDASPEDDDEYICLAENRAGAAKASAKVQVHCKYDSTL